MGSWVLLVGHAGNSIFFAVKRIEDPIGLLPAKLILGINKARPALPSGSMGISLRSAHYGARASTCRMWLLETCARGSSGL